MGRVPKKTRSLLCSCLVGAGPAFFSAALPCRVHNELYIHGINYMDYITPEVTYNTRNITGVMDTLHTSYIRIYIHCMHSVHNTRTCMPNVTPVIQVTSTLHLHSTHLPRSDKRLYSASRGATTFPRMGGSRTEGHATPHISCEHQGVASIGSLPGVIGSRKDADLFPWTSSPISPPNYIRGESMSAFSIFKRSVSALVFLVGRSCNIVHSLQMPLAYTIILRR